MVAVRCWSKFANRSSGLAAALVLASIASLTVADETVVVTDSVLVASRPAAGEPTLTPPANQLPAADSLTGGAAPPATMTARDKDDVASGLMRHQPEIAPALFQGMRPGTSTREELITSWGEPQQRTPHEGGELLSYAIRPFRNVEVLVENDTIAAIKVELAKPEAAKILARKVQVDGIEAVEINDDQGALVGYAYPERGMVFATGDAGGRLVGHMLLQPLDPLAFALRAERRAISAVDANLHDLQTALSINDKFAYAWWLLAEVKLGQGLADEALSAANEALAIEPENPAYTLRKAECEFALERLDDAVLATRAVIDDTSAPSIVRAQALHQLAQLAALGDAEISGKVVDFENDAIALADELATGDDRRERMIAKRLLVDAHLAVAREVARRDFADKQAVIAEWVTRASGFAEEAIEHDGGDLELRLRVAEGALAALSNVKPPLDPQPWIDELLDTYKVIEESGIDPLWQRQLDWRMGVAYLNAVQVEHHRRDLERAQEYAERAVELLAKGGETRLSMPRTEQTAGRMYFHLGALHAVLKKDHAAAVQWYDRAEPLLRAERPNNSLWVPRRDGEALVSMGVSYWQQNDRQHAVELTVAGAKLLERAVAAGVVEDASLAVPYGNLSTMYKQLGDETEAMRYARLASGVPLAPQAPGANPGTGTPISTTPEIPRGSSSAVRSMPQPVAQGEITPIAPPMAMAKPAPVASAGPVLLPASPPVAKVASRPKVESSAADSYNLPWPPKSPAAGSENLRPIKVPPPGSEKKDRGMFGWKK